MPKVKPFSGRLEPKRVLYQQCPHGNDGDLGHAVIHSAHVHQTKHGRPVVCRGWFPEFHSARGGIRWKP